MTEEKKKKLTASERKNMQRNADAVQREIERNKRRMELMKEAASIKLSKDNYQFAPGFQVTMKYQNDPAYIEASRQLDALAADSEIAKTQGIIDDAQARLDNYLAQLAERG